MLEAEASAQGNYARGESAGDGAEIGAADVVRDVIRVEIQIVEDIVGVDAEFELGVFRRAPALWAGRRPWTASDPNPCIPVV